MVHWWLTPEALICNLVCKFGIGWMWRNFISWSMQIEDLDQWFNISYEYTGGSIRKSITFGVRWFTEVSGNSSWLYSFWPASQQHGLNLKSVSSFTFSQPLKEKCIKWGSENWWYNHLSSEKAMKSQILHTVWKGYMGIWEEMNTHIIMTRNERLQASLMLMFVNTCAVSTVACVGQQGRCAAPRSLISPWDTWEPTLSSWIAAKGTLVLYTEWLEFVPSGTFDHFVWRKFFFSFFLFFFFFGGGGGGEGLGDSRPSAPSARCHQQCSSPVLTVNRLGAGFSQVALATFKAAPQPKPLSCWEAWLYNRNTGNARSQSMFTEML